VAVCFALFLCESAMAGDLFGVVTRKGVTAQLAPAARRYRTTGVEQSALKEAEQCNCNPSLYAVVSLWSDRAPARRATGARPTMAQKDKRFVPTVLAVQVGDTVSFPNMDPFFHNVFSYSKVKRFDLGRYDEGESADVVFDKPGVAQVYCEIHSSMRAYIHVFDTPYFTVSDEQGRFKVDSVPAGTYHMRVWQEGLPDLERDVTVPADSSFVEVAP
jgi:plastocyanin